jgi:putative ABC transport system permease protein
MLADLAHAFRSWLKTPRLTLTLLACIAVSIGGTATVLTFVYSLLLRPLPYPAADRLVILNPLAVGGVNQATRPYFSYPDFADLRAGASAYEMLEGATVSRLIVQTDSGFERLRGETVTPGYFSLFGLQPQVGRTFTAAEFAGTGPRTILLSSRIWRTRFGSDPAIVGRSLVTRAGPAEVIGIMPDHYAGIAEGDGTDYWLAEKQNNHPAMLTDQTSPTTLVFGRLKPGVTFSAAAAETNGILAGLASAVPGTPRQLSARLSAFGEQWRESLRPGLITLLAGSLFLLAIGCANVAILQLARLVGRERELAVRLALGASRTNLLRLLFAESLVLALAGGGAGLVLATWLKGLFVKLGGTDLPTQLPVVFSSAPLLVCLGVVLLTGIVFGLLPAVVAVRIDSSAALRSGGRGFAGGALQGRSGRLLVIGQTALAVTLLAGAALFLRSYEKLRYLDFGYRTDGLLRYQVSIQPESHATPEAQAAFFRSLDADLRALPGVRNFGYMGPTLPPYDPGETQLRVKGADFPTTDGALGVNWHAANNDLFSILRVPLKEGRWFGPEDRRGGQAVALVSETLARRIAPNGSALGRTLAFNNAEVVVVGVVADARWNGQRNRRPTYLNLFVSHDQFPRPSVGVLVDCAMDPHALIEPIRKAVLARDATAALHWIDTMEEALDYQTVNERFWTVLAGAYAVTAFLLAALGLYGVLAHGVSSRVREIGIRMALGASANGVARMIVGQGLRLVATGLAAGLGLTLLSSRWLESKLYGTSAQDPVALGAVALLLFIAATAICWLPARRAARVNPIEALRAE